MAKFIPHRAALPEGRIESPAWSDRGAAALVQDLRIPGPWREHSGREGNYLGELPKTPSRPIRRERASPLYFPQPSFWRYDRIPSETAGRR